MTEQTANYHLNDYATKRALEREEWKKKLAPAPKRVVKAQQKKNNSFLRFLGL